MTCRALVAVLVVGSSASALAAPAPGERSAETVMAQAETDFRAGRFEAALQGFEEVRARTGEIGLLYPIARCYEELDRLEEALATYEQLVGEQAVPPEGRARADTAVRNLRARLATGRLVLQISPFGAAVTVDGRDVGVAPVAPLELTPGKHRVVVRAPGAAAVTQDVEVRGGRTVTLAIELEGAPRVGRLALSVTPAGATVAVDGVVVGTTPLGPLELPPGVRRVAVSREGFAAERREVEVRAGETTVLTLALREAVEARAGSPWPWVTLGVGAAVAIGGGVAVWLGEQDHLEITGAEGYAEGRLVGLSRDRALALEASGDDKKLIGWVLVGVGGAALVTSIILFATSGSADEGAARVVPAVTAGPDGVGIGAFARF